MKKVVALIIFLSFASCTSENKKNEVDLNVNKIENTKTMKLSKVQKSEIEEALKVLLTRENFDAFVIITEKKSDNFIQFAVEEGKLLIDLPTKQLSQVQLTHAKEILKFYKIEHTVQNYYDPNDDTKITGEFSSFTSQIADINTAVEIVEKISTQVFNLNGEVILSFETN